MLWSTGARLRERSSIRVEHVALPAIAGQRSTARSTDEMEWSEAKRRPFTPSSSSSSPYKYAPPPIHIFFFLLPLLLSPLSSHPLGICALAIFGGGARTRPRIPEVRSITIFFFAIFFLGGTFWSICLSFSLDPHSFLRRLASESTHLRLQMLCSACRLVRVAGSGGNLPSAVS